MLISVSEEVMTWNKNSITIRYKGDTLVIDDPVPFLWNLLSDLDDLCGKGIDYVVAWNHGREAFKKEVQDVLA